MKLHALVRRTILLTEVRLDTRCWADRNDRFALVAFGSKAALTVPKSDFSFTPESGLNSDITPCPKSADIVAKVFLRWRRKNLRAADAFYARRREGPYRFIQN